MRAILVVLLLGGCVGLTLALTGVLRAEPTERQLATSQGAPSVPAAAPEAPEAESPGLKAQAAPPSKPAAAGKKAFFQYVDASGTVHFVDSIAEVPEPLRSKAKRIELSVRPGGGGRAAASRPAWRMPHRWALDVTPDHRQPEVIVYTTTWCGWCRKTLAHLDSKGVDYENLNIEADPAAAARLRRLTGRNAVPVLEIGGKVVQGFDRARIDQLLDET